VPNPSTIDAEFEVVDAGGGLPPETDARRWTFWRDDLPNLVGLAAGFGMLFILKVYAFPHLPTWSSLFHH
jgi:hypothetical protein